MNPMGPAPPVSLPPVTAEYTSVLQPPKPSAPPAQSAYRFTRASDGKTRVDSGNTSVISNPAAGQTILLDHLKKSATIHPTPPATPQMPGTAPASKFALPGIPAAPHLPGVQVQDLGKSVLQGHQVEGKRYLVPPALPKAPAMPKLPKLAAPGLPKLPKTPAMPQTPHLPGMPQMPKPPQPTQAPKPAGAPPPLPATALPPVPRVPTTAEVWTSTGMHVPMMTKMNGGFGQLTQVCQRAVPGEPHPATFQIPADYKVSSLPAKPPAPPAPAGMSPTAPSR